MKNEELFRDYKQDVSELRYRDKDHLDRIIRKGKMLIKNVYGDQSDYLTDFGRIRFYPAYAPATEEVKRDTWASAQTKILNLVNIMLEEASLFGTPAERISTDAETFDRTESNRVFIVHGHDENAKITVARFLEKLGLEAIILHEQASKGRTIIEKFEEHASASCFAIALLTTDDVGYAKDHEAAAKPRARQNVIFELGYFCGALGRKNVAVLYQEGVEIPNDYLGVVYTLLDDTGAWQMSIAKELKLSGVDFDMNKVLG